MSAYVRYVSEKCEAFRNTDHIPEHFELCSLMLVVINQDSIKSYDASFDDFDKVMYLLEDLYEESRRFRLVLHAVANSPRDLFIKMVSTPRHSCGLSELSKSEYASLQISAKAVLDFIISERNMSPISI